MMIKSLTTSWKNTVAAEGYGLKIPSLIGIGSLIIITFIIGLIIKIIFGIFMFVLNAIKFVIVKIIEQIIMLVVMALLVVGGGYFYFSNDKDSMKHISGAGKNLVRMFEESSGMKVPAFISKSLGDGEAETSEALELPELPNIPKGEALSLATIFSNESLPEALAPLANIPLNSSELAAYGRIISTYDTTEEQTQAFVPLLAQNLFSQDKGLRDASYYALTKINSPESKAAIEQYLNIVKHAEKEVKDTGR